MTFNLIFRAPFSETAPQFSIIHTGTRILATFRHAKNQILGSEIVPVLHVQTQYNRLPFADDYKLATEKSGVLTESTLIFSMVSTVSSAA